MPANHNWFDIKLSHRKKRMRLNACLSFNMMGIFLFLFIIGPLKFLDANTPIDSFSVPLTIQMDNLKKKNYSQFCDILSYAPGINIRAFGTPGQPAVLRYRGCFINQSVVLLDGIPLLEPWNQMFDLNMIPIEMIDLIEIYPSINPYGTHAVGGVINLVSKKYPLEKPYSQFSYRTGNRQFSQFDVSFGQKILPTLSITSGALLEKYAENSPDSAYKSQKIRSGVQYQPFSFLDIHYQILSQQTSNRTYYPLPMPMDTIITNVKIEQKRYDHTLKSHLSFSNIQTKILYRYSTSKNRFKTADTLKTFPIQSSSLLFQQMIDSTFLPLQWGINYTKQSLVLPDSLKLKDDYADAYIQLHRTLPTQVNVLMQLHTHYTPGKKTFTFIDGQISKHLTRRLTGWISLTHGIRRPSIGEQFGVPSFPLPPAEIHSVWRQTQLTQIVANKNLEAETSQNMELGFSYGNKQSLHLSLRGYNRNHRNLIQTTEMENGIQFTNVTGSVNFKGFESDLHLKISSFETCGTLTYLHTEDNNKNQLPERPSITGNAEIAWYHQFLKDDIKLRISMGIRFWSEFWSFRYHIQSNTCLRDNHQSGFIVNGKITATIIKNADVFLGVDNITKTSVAWISTYVIPKNTMRLGFTWRLVD